MVAYSISVRLDYNHFLKHACVSNEKIISTNNLLPGRWKRILKNVFICFIDFSLHSKCLKLGLFFKILPHIWFILDYFTGVYGIEEIAIYIHKYAMRKFNIFFITYLLSPVNLILFKGVIVYTVDFYYGFEFISCTKETKTPNFILAINSYFTFHTLIHSTIRYYLVTFHQTQDFNISPCRDSISIPTPFFFPRKSHSRGKYSKNSY